MPFHGLASQVVLSALREGQGDCIFTGIVPGPVAVDELVAGHRRRKYEHAAAWETLNRFINGLGVTSREARRRSILLRSARKNPRVFDNQEELSHDNNLAEVPEPARHPFWHFEAAHLRNLQVLLCAGVLVFAGVLCSAGGIGGGGIYVTLLMVAGGLEVVDAVPLSKAIVFLGSVPSLILNVKKTMSGKTLIDYNICRLVVPCSLLGTYVGVFLNRLLPSWVLLLVLSVMLIFMTAMVTRTTVEQYLEEEAHEDKRRSKEEGEPPAGRSTGDADSSQRGLTRAFVEAHRRGRRISHSSHGSASASRESALATRPDAGVSLQSTSPKRSVLTRRDGFVFISMLVVIIISGVFRFHAGLCKDAVEHVGGVLDSAQASCRHPALLILGQDTLQIWMQSIGVSNFLLALSVALPTCICSLVALWYSIGLLRTEGWCLAHVVSYDAMAIVTGCLAGLVGIGGGLVFAPFFLLMAVEPSIAVATSSTCVIFTSSSTTFQYLLTDRIIISLAIVYGVVNVAASYAGTSFVHFLQDNFQTRRSYISGIVGVGVLVSAVLALIKLASAAAGVATVH